MLPWCHFKHICIATYYSIQTRISFKLLHPFFHCLRICEICGSTACNVAGFCDADFIEQWNESSSTAAAQATANEPRRFWQGHRFLKFLLACMVFAFVISWLCHFNVPGWVLSWCTLFLIKAPKAWQTKYGQVSWCKLAEHEKRTGDEQELLGWNEGWC